MRASRHRFSIFSFFFFLVLVCHVTVSTVYGQADFYGAPNALQHNDNGTSGTSQHVGYIYGLLPNGTAYEAPLSRYISWNGTHTTVVLIMPNATSLANCHSLPLCFRSSDQPSRIATYIEPYNQSHMTLYGVMLYREPGKQGFWSNLFGGAGNDVLASWVYRLNTTELYEAACDVDDPGPVSIDDDIVRISDQSLHEPYFTVDRSDNIHIVARHTAGFGVNNLWYFKVNSTDSVTEKYKVSKADGYWPRIGVMDDGTMWITYLTRKAVIGFVPGLTKHQLWWMYQRHGLWSDEKDITTVKYGTTSCPYDAAGFDNRIDIAYLDPGNQSLMYLTVNRPSWLGVNPVCVHKNVSWGPDLSVSDKGIPFFACVDMYVNGTRFVALDYNGTDWIETTARPRNCTEDQYLWTSTIYDSKADRYLFSWFDTGPDWDDLPSDYGWVIAWLTESNTFDPQAEVDSPDTVNLNYWFEVNVTQRQYTFHNWRLVAANNETGEVIDTQFFEEGLRPNQIHTTDWLFKEPMNVTFTLSGSGNDQWIPVANSSTQITNYTNGGAIWAQPYLTAEDRIAVSYYTYDLDPTLDWEIVLYAADIQKWLEKKVGYIESPWEWKMEQILGTPSNYTLLNSSYAVGQTFLQIAETMDINNTLEILRRNVTNTNWNWQNLTLPSIVSVSVGKVGIGVYMLRLEGTNDYTVTDLVLGNFMVRTPNARSVVTLNNGAGITGGDYFPVNISVSYLKGTRWIDGYLWEVTTPIESEPVETGVQSRGDPLLLRLPPGDYVMKVYLIRLATDAEFRDETYLDTMMFPESFEALFELRTVSGAEVSKGNAFRTFMVENKPFEVNPGGFLGEYIFMLRNSLGLSPYAFLGMLGVFLTGGSFVLGALIGGYSGNSFAVGAMLGIAGLIASWQLGWLGSSWLFIIILVVGLVVARFLLSMVGEPGVGGGSVE